MSNCECPRCQNPEEFDARTEELTTKIVDRIFSLTSLRGKQFEEVVDEVCGVMKEKAGGSLVFIMLMSDDEAYALTDEAYTETMRVN